MQNEKQNLTPRPPIVVVVGHIDHGKTSILDHIRKTKVAEKEAGGITQHIGAYEIAIEGKPSSAKATEGKRITFIDTPGHEAFSKMRSRGAKIADIAILVVAADEGVKTQTREALEAIKEANISFILAINKIDKENANPERVKKELVEKEVYVESIGGKIPSINISAKTGQGVNELLEMVLLVAEMEELKAEPDVPGSGVVIESHLEPKRGIAATLIIQNGVLKKKMFIQAGSAVAPVKIFENFLGQSINEASFSTPVKIVGFDKLPEVGRTFQCFESKEEAQRAAINEKSGHPKEEKPTIKEAKTVIPLIIKTDVSGSLEALEKEIMKLATEEVHLDILRLNVGNITEDDIKFASSTQQPIIVGFRVKAESGMAQMAERLGITLVFFDVIYKVNEWLEEEIKKRLPETAEEEILGKAELIKIFRKEKNKQIVGGRVISGKIVDGKYVRIIRRETIVAKGKILELQHNRIRVPEVEEGKEFGVLLEIKGELAKNDLIEIYGV